MITVEVHKDKLRQAAFELSTKLAVDMEAYQKEVEEAIEIDLRVLPYYRKVTPAMCAAIVRKLVKERGDETRELCEQLIAACNVAEEYVTVDAKTLQKLFPQ